MPIMNTRPSTLLNLLLRALVRVLQVFLFVLLLVTLIIGPQMWRWKHQLRVVRWRVREFGQRVIDGPGASPWAILPLVACVFCFLGIFVAMDWTRNKGVIPSMIGIAFVILCAAGTYLLLNWLDDNSPPAPDFDGPATLSDAMGCGTVILFVLGVLAVISTFLFKDAAAKFAGWLMAALCFGGAALMHARIPPEPPPSPDA
jgi:UDP-N-acetylmuramyl pentapeptide phosphotransferase/UDP-N-acetylglucosamine-1-phosphate transferase